MQPQTIQHARITSFAEHYQIKNKHALELSYLIETLAVAHFQRRHLVELQMYHHQNQNVLLVPQD